MRVRWAPLLTPTCDSLLSASAENSGDQVAFAAGLVGRAVNCRLLVGVEGCAGGLLPCPSANFFL